MTRQCRRGSARRRDSGQFWAVAPITPRGAATWDGSWWRHLVNHRLVMAPVAGTCVTKLLRLMSSARVVEALPRVGRVLHMVRGGAGAPGDGRRRRRRRDEERRKLRQHRKGGSARVDQGRPEEFFAFQAFAAPRAA